MFSSWRAARLFSSDDTAETSRPSQPNVESSNLRMMCNSHDHIADCPDDNLTFGDKYQHSPHGLTDKLAARVPSRQVCVFLECQS